MKEESVIQLIKVCFNDIELSKQLIDIEPGIVNSRTGLGEKALQYLSVENHLEAVIFLFHNGAKINTENDCGGTPLFESSSLGYIESVCLSVTLINL